MNLSLVAEQPTVDLTNYIWKLESFVDQNIGAQQANLPPPSLQIHTYRDILNVFFLRRYEAVTLKNVQSKLTDAEAEAEKMLMLGAHSRGPADDGESVPIWVNIFRKYFEMKKTNYFKEYSA